MPRRLAPSSLGWASGSRSTTPTKSSAPRSARRRSRRFRSPAWWATRRSSRAASARGATAARISRRCRWRRSLRCSGRKPGFRTATDRSRDAPSAGRAPAWSARSVHSRAGRRALKLLGCGTRVAGVLLLICRSFSARRGSRRVALGTRGNVRPTLNPQLSTLDRGSAARCSRAALRLRRSRAVFFGQGNRAKVVDS